LGILAGDYLKEASDCRLNMTAVGFFYRNGYFPQSISMDGQQIAHFIPQDFNQLPILLVKDEQGQPFVLDVEFPGYKVYCNVWKIPIIRPTVSMTAK
jgi:starch phosphorylase